MASGPGYLIFETDTYNYEPEADETNNTDTVAITVEESDLVVSSASAPTDAGLGSTVSVSWTVANQSAVSTASSDWYDAVYLSPTGVLDGSQVYLGTFYEFSGGLAPGASYADTESVTIPYAASGAQNYLIFEADTYNYEPESDETNNTFTVPITIHGADLAVSGANATVSTANAGDTIALSYTVTNQGDAPALNLTGGGWYDAYYIGSNPTFDGTAQFITSSWEGANAPLPAGISYSVSQLSVTIPGSVSPGQKYLFVYADYEAQYNYYYYFDYYASPDANLANNVQAIPITITAPDLTITAASAPSTAIVSQTINVSWTDKNIGVNPADASYWYDEVYLSTTPNLSGSYVYAGEFSVSGPLAAGSSFTQNQSIQVPSGLGTGALYLVFDVNAFGYQSETDETNNTFAVPITLSAPELVVSSVTSTMTVAALNQTIPVSWTVTNDGNVQAPASWYDRVWLSSSPTSLSGTYYDLGDFYTGSLTPLGAHQSYTQNQNVLIPNNLILGTYYIIIQADVNNDQGETDESNNLGYSSTAMVVGAPDLIVSTASAASFGVNNETIPVSFTVTNQSPTYVATGPWYDAVLLTGNGYNVLLSLPYNGSFVPLAAGASYTQNQNITIPNYIPSGSYNLVFQTNYEYYYYYYYQGESNPNNDTYTLPITISSARLDDHVGNNAVVGNGRPECLGFLHGSQPGLDHGTRPVVRLGLPLSSLHAR